MLLEVADKKRSRNVREGAVNHPRKSTSAKITSERHVRTMSNSSRMLQHSKSCRCVCDGDTASALGLRQHKLRLEDLQIPRIPTSDFTTHGNIVAAQNKMYNINEDLDRRVPRYEDINMNVTRDDAWSCPRICIDTTKESHQLVTVDNDSLAGSPKDRCPIIRLSLRKPRNWQWKLTTSASSPAIVLPVIRLTDEHGDLLLDTGEKSESNKDVDGNGNSKEYPSGLTQKSRYKPSVIRKDEQHINGAAADGAVLGKDSERKQKTTLLRNVSLEEGQGFIFAERHRTEGKVDKKSCCCKNRRTQSVCTSLRSVSGHESQSSGCDVGSRCKDPSRNKVHRRIMERRRNRRHASASSDSSPEVRRRTKRGSRARGRTECRTSLVCARCCWFLARVVLSDWRAGVCRIWDRLY
jgi:hypothetical protein